VLLASLLLGSEGIIAMPLVIVAVVVAFVATAWLEPVGPPASQGHGDNRLATTSLAAEEKVSGVDAKDELPAKDGNLPPRDSVAEGRKA
jgi:hypothetical protein